MIISAQKGKANKMHISIGGEYRFTVDADFWFSCGYLAGDEIDEEQLRELEGKAACRRCFNRALNILSLRDHCEKELYRKLERADGEIAAKSAVEKVKNLGLVNDEQYAKNLARELAERKGYSARAIKSELIHRGIDRETAESAAEEIPLDESAKIRVLLEGKYARRLNDEKGRRQVFNALLRLGYDYSEIRSAMREYDDGFSEDESI